MSGLAGLPPLSLEEINARAALVTRTCRKYLVPEEVVDSLFPPARFGVLTIGGRTSFRYSSTYLDTPDLRCFRDQRQGRRLRYKARVRTYEDTGTRMFEIKLKGSRAVTDKVRVEHDGDAMRLTPASRRFLDDTLTAYGIDPPKVLVPSAVTDYRRATAVALSGEERVTVDTELVGRRKGWSVAMRPGRALLEVKTRVGLTETERRLHELGFRAVAFTKYASTLVSLEPGFRGNKWHRTMAACLDHPIRERIAV